MSCNNWYLDAKYESKEDCIDQQNNPKETSTGTDSVTEDTVSSTKATTSAEHDTERPANGIRNQPDVVIAVPTEEVSSEEWTDMYGDTTESETVPTTEEISYVPFTADEVFTADRIEARVEENGRAVVHVEFGGVQLGLAITGTAVGVILLVTGVIALSEYITRRLFDEEANPNADPERSTFPLTAVQPTAPEDSRDVEESVAGTFQTAMESTLVPGSSSGSFNPPISPLRTSSLPNLVPSSSGQPRRQIERTQSTIAFNLDDTVGDEFDALALRHQPAQSNLSNLTILRPAGQIIADVEVHEEARVEEARAGEVEAEEARAEEARAEEARAEEVEAEEARVEEVEAEEARAEGENVETSQRRKSTRLRRKFHPTQYGNL